MKTLEKYSITSLWILATVLAVITGQSVGMGIPFIDALPIALFVVLLSLGSVIIKDVLPKKLEFPTFAWAVLLGVAVTIGDTPLARWITEQSKNLQFIATTTPLLAFAGLSMVDQLPELKKLSWRIMIIAIVVFVSIFFICASIAHIVLKLQGVI